MNSIKVSPILTVALALVCFFLPGCAHQEEHEHEAHKVLATSPVAKSVTLEQRFVCQIHSQRHIEIRNMEQGYLEAITVKEGQQVKKDEPLFKVIPVLFEARLAAENAEAELARLELSFTQKLFENKAVSQNEVQLYNAKLKKAQAKAALAQAELRFATVIAPFDGIVDRLHHQQGSLIQEGEVLTTLSDNSLMWVYFNVPEKRYLEYMDDMNQRNHEEPILDRLNGVLKVDLELANGEKFTQAGRIGAIEADFNNQTGNIAFRADIPNPDRLLRHGQTGTLVVSRVQKDALVIPQRATFEVLSKRYVYVIDKDNIAHQREITPENELEDLFVIEQGSLTVDDKIVLEGVRQIHDGESVEFEDREPEEVAGKLKYHAE